VRVHVREGDVVREGQPLVSIDTEDFLLRVREAEAALRGAADLRDAAKVDFARAQGLLADKSLPQSQFDAAQARYEGGQAGVAQAEASLDMARKAVRDTVVRAPYDGVVTRRLVSEGEFAAALPPTPLVTVEETAVIDLRVAVPASAAGHVREGTRLAAHLPATGRRFEAAVRRVVPSLDPRTRTFPAIAEIANPDGALRPGMFAEVRLLGDAAVEPAP
jgi:membrane fusion protein (multidrug efflux system)